MILDLITSESQKNLNEYLNEKEFPIKIDVQNKLGIIEVSYTREIKTDN